MTTDPMCGMTVAEGSALRAERDGLAFCSCGKHCRRHVLSAPANAKHGKELRGCCQSAVPESEPSDRPAARISDGTGAGVMKRIVVPWMGAVYSPMILTRFVIPPVYVLW